MLQMSQREPRRFWRRGKYESDRFGPEWAAELGREPARCAACDSDEGVALDLGVPFCAECLAWSKQSNLDDDYDDLGVAG